MTKRILMSGTALGLSALLTACASAPPNPKVEDARAAYEAIEDDPYVARAGSGHLRDAEQALQHAESLMEEDVDSVEVDHAAYLANRHAEIASEQGKRARLQDEIANAENRRKQLTLQEQTMRAQQAQSEAERLRQEMEALQAKQTERGMVLTLGDVLFDLNKSELKSSGERTVERLAEFMREYPERRVRVEGYTDSTGAADYNQQLSERRAEAVRNALMLAGIESSRVELQGFGEQYPVASNDDASGRQQNRRVEIVISDQEGNIQTR
ncbi:OmpA family protein [Marinobacter fonticola]|uniref:OmpA family protein n=1 Tax=Marinobacter fonticola TaxID=2603215 RepID=UPI0011E678C4|nr:OmpA family protein [Marinobacter fonticola]